MPPVFTAGSFEAEPGFCISAVEILQEASESNFQKAISFLFKTIESTAAVNSEECFLSPWYHSF